MNPNPQTDRAADSQGLETMTSPSTLRDRYLVLHNQTLEVEPKTFSNSLFAQATRSDFSIAALLDELKKLPSLSFLYRQDARVLEGYTIEEHTGMFLGQFESYLKNGLPIAGISVADLRIAAALHDIGKPLPDNKRDQHSEIIRVISDIREYLPWSDRNAEILKSIIAHDPLGKLIVGSLASLASIPTRQELAKTATERTLSLDELREFAALVQLKPISEESLAAVEIAANDICSRAQSLGISAEELLRLQILLYQSDTAAYNYDAVAHTGRRASPGLEFLYSFNEGFDSKSNSRLLVRDESSGLILFSPKVNEIVGHLQAAVASRR